VQIGYRTDPLAEPASLTGAASPADKTVVESTAAL
jgi:hypothetical protein